MRQVWIAIALIVSSGCASVATAPPGLTVGEPRILQPQPGGLFERADFDRDGRLSQEEVDRSLPRISHSFSQADANRDGYVTYRELRRYLGMHHWQTLEELL